LAASLSQVPYTGAAKRPGVMEGRAVLGMRDTVLHLPHGSSTLTMPALQPRRIITVVRMSATAARGTLTRRHSHRTSGEWHLQVQELGADALILDGHVDGQLAPGVQVRIIVLCPHVRVCAAALAPRERPLAEHRHAWCSLFK